MSRVGPGRIALVLAALLAGGAAEAGAAGDPARGRAIVTSRQRGLCLLCHAGPFPEERFQGNLGPSLAGVGDRLSPEDLRARLVDPRAMNPRTIMPAYARTEGLTRVGRPWQGRPVLGPDEIEDVVAFLSTLREETPPKTEESR